MTVEHEYIPNAAPADLVIVRELTRLPTETPLKGYVLIAVNDAGVCAVATNSPDDVTTGLYMMMAMDLMQRGASDDGNRRR